MVTKKTDEWDGVAGFLDAVRNSTQNLRERYKDDPVALAEKFGLKFPRKPVEVMQELGVYDAQKHGPITPGLRELIQEVCSGTIEDAVAVANRGGGKSQGVSFIEFFMVFMKDYDALNLGGSELQAKGVYNYLLSYIEHSPEFKDMLKGDPTISETHTKNDAWIRVLTASSKSVRSPHAGGYKRNSGRWAGGLLVIDEEAEADREIVDASLYTINTATPGVNVRASTFHNAEGTFADLIDNHVEMGYKMYNWNIFDVANKCDCDPEVGCQSEEKCFREDHYEDYVDPQTGAAATKLLHRAYCGGRSIYADGWIPMAEILKVWRRSKRNHASFEVEAMGSRPSSAGFVIKDLQQFASNFTDTSGKQIYMPGFPVTICVDWGARAAGIEVWQEQPQDHHALVYSEQAEENGVSQVIGKLLGLVEQYRSDFKEIRADIGGGGNYLNPKLRDEHRLPVVDCNFAEMKEAAVAALNVFSESKCLVIPRENEVYISQSRNWKRNNAGHIVKGNDHMMDASICYFSQFIDRLGLTYIRIVPKAVRTNAGRIDDAQQSSTGSAPAVARSRVATVRTLTRR